MQGAIVFLGGKIDPLHWLAVERSFWFSEIDLLDILLVAFAQLNIYDFCWLQSSQGWNLFQCSIFETTKFENWLLLEMLSVLCDIFLNSSPTNREHPNLEGLTSWKMEPVLPQ